MGISWSRAEKGPRSYRRKVRQSVPGSCDHKESHAPKGTSSLHQTLFHSRGPGTLVGYLVVSRLESPGISRYRASGPAKKGALIPSSHTASVSLFQQAWGQPFPALPATLCPAPPLPPPPTHSEIKPPTHTKTKITIKR